MDEFFLKYKQPFKNFWKKIAIGILLIGTGLFFYIQELGLLVVNFALFILNFSEEELENSRIFRARYQTFKIVLLTASLLVLSTTSLSLLNSNIEMDLNLNKFLFIVNAEYVLFFRFFLFRIKS